MNRRNFIKHLSKTGIATTIASGISSSCLKEKRPKPNIIFILADDLGYGDLSCFGQTIFQTPNIDRMAKEGKIFTNFYAGSTVCAPSRASLMTGFHTGHCWVRGNYETGPHGFGACLELRPQDLTITEILKDHGYATGVFGKWGLGVETTTGQPDKKGVDEFFGYLNQGHAHFYYSDYLWENGEKITIKENQNGQRGVYCYDLIVDESLDFIKRHKQEPFFLYLPWTIPHAEMLVPDDSIEPFLGKWPEELHCSQEDGGSGHYATQKSPRAAFAGMVTRMDRDVGRILDELKECGIENNTLVMFSSDNGPHHEGGHDPLFFNSSGTLRGLKRDLYEGGIRVPTIARWPGIIEPNTKSDFIAAFWDVLPTICHLIGIPMPGNIDGLSFLPELMGKSSQQKKHEYLYWEFHEGKTTAQAVRVGDWKAVRLAPSSDIELYNLKEDVSEQHDISKENVDIVIKMKNYLDNARTPHDIWPLKDL